MSIRLGGILLTPNTVMVLLAGGFFWALTFRRLYPAIAPSKKASARVLLAASCLGVALGVAYARMAGTGTSRDALDIHLGSLGGYWGVILGALLAARALCLDAGKIAGAFVPGIAAGGMIARIGCLFTGCCRGYAAGPAILHPWPAYDALALAVAYAVSCFASRPGKRAALFFLAYGILRFTLEFARPSVPLCGALSINAAFALAQSGIALLMLSVPARRRGD